MNSGVDPSSATTGGLANPPKMTGTRGSFADANGNAFFVGVEAPLTTSTLSLTLSRAVELTIDHRPRLTPFACDVAML